VRAREHPWSWEYNAVRVESAGPLEARELAAAADGWLGDLHHRRVEVEDDALGGRLAPGFRELGWTTEALLWMLHPDPAAAGAGGDVLVEPAEFHEIRPLHRAWLAEEAVVLPEADLRAFLDDDAAVGAVRGVRCLVVREGGRAAAYARYAVGGDTGEVEDVYCTPARRGNGLGRALVHAVQAAAAREGARATLICADLAGRPRRLYAHLGFRPAWVQHVFWRSGG
jgi:GNAT superfamily N-acetyltransferase